MVMVPKHLECVKDECKYPEWKQLIFLFRTFWRLAGQPTLCPFISRGRSAEEGGQMLNFELMLTSAFHQDNFWRLASLHCRPSVCHDNVAPNS